LLHRFGMASEKVGGEPIIFVLRRNKPTGEDAYRDRDARRSRSAVDDEGAGDVAAEPPGSAQATFQAREPA
jgi:hypothetical protein